MKNQIDFVCARGVKEFFGKVSEKLRPVPHFEIPDKSLLPVISDEDYVRLTRESMVTIGINRVPTFRRSWRRPLTYSRLRDIEAPMLGACYLTEWTEGLTELYDLGIEIETYRTAEEMAAKLEALKVDPEKRARLRQAGQKRALRDHSVPRSIHKICDALGLT